MSAGALFARALANKPGSVLHGRVFSCGVPRNNAVVGRLTGAVGGATTEIAFLGLGIVAFKWTSHGSG